jgi:hypothetical protein
VPARLKPFAQLAMVHEQHLVQRFIHDERGTRYMAFQAGAGKAIIVGLNKGAIPVYSSRFSGVSRMFPVCA